MPFDAKGHYSGKAAQGYEAARTPDPKWQREQETVERFLARAAPQSVLDAPVGTGRFVPLYSDIEDVIGLDISADMIAQVPPSPNVRLQVGDITELPIDDNEVDLSVCVRLLNLIPWSVAEQALRELVRVSRQHVLVGVRVAQPTTPRHFWFRLRSRLRAVAGASRKVTPHPRRLVDDTLDQVGLKVVERVEIDRWPDGSTYYMLLARVR